MSFNLYPLVQNIELIRTLIYLNMKSHCLHVHNRSFKVSFVKIKLRNEG